MIPLLDYPISVNCHTVRCDVLGIVTHKNVDEWVNKKGGYYVSKRRKLPEPLIHIVFSADVDIDLEPNVLYFDGKYKFLATDKRRIVLIETLLSSFSIPQKLTRIGSIHKEL